jgi:hypothetical protein
VFDWVQTVVGRTADAKGHFQVQRPESKIRNADGSLEVVESNVPDLIAVTATLGESPTVQKRATLQARFRRGQPFPGEPPLWLTINGEKGEIRLTNGAAASVHSSADPELIKIEVHDFESDEVERVQWDWAEWQKELPAIARSIGSIYEEFAKGDEGVYATFEDALALHEQLEGMIAPFYA